MERLWSPWRLAYVTGSKNNDDGCVFCVAARACGTTTDAPLGLPSRGVPADDPASLLVHCGTSCFVVLNLYPYNNGHLMVVPYRHVASLAALQPDELQELASLTQTSEMALTEAYQPHGLNVGINLGKPAGAGILDHLHVHLVPRWNGDTNFMTVVADVRVLPEDLQDSVKRLRPIFQRIANNQEEAGRR